MTEKAESSVTNRNCSNVTTVPGDIEKKIRFLHRVFIGLLLLLTACVVATPLILGSRVFPQKSLILDEDLFESVLIAGLFAIAGAIFARYRQRIRSLYGQLGQMFSTNTRLKGRLTDAFRYIGTVNVQLQEIHGITSEMVRYPENRREFKQMLASAGSKALSIVGKDWILIRVVDRHTLKTLIEHWETRGKTSFKGISVSNRLAVNSHALENLDHIQSHRDNSTASVLCVFSLPRLNQEERILIQAVAAEMEMLYTIFALQSTLKKTVKNDDCRQLNRQKIFSQRSVYL
jgi:hypothetical protein